MDSALQGRRGGEVQAGTTRKALQLSARRLPPPLKCHTPPDWSDQSLLTGLRFAKSHLSCNRKRKRGHREDSRTGDLCFSGRLIPSSLLPDSQDQQTDPGQQRRHLGSPKTLTQAPAGTKGTKPGGLCSHRPARPRRAGVSELMDTPEREPMRKPLSFSKLRPSSGLANVPNTPRPWLSTVNACVGQEASLPSSVLS